MTRRIIVQCRLEALDGHDGYVLLFVNPVRGEACLEARWLVGRRRSIDMPIRGVLVPIRVCSFIPFLLRTSVQSMIEESPPPNNSVVK